MALHAFSNLMSNTLLFAFIGGIPLYGMLKKVNVFDSFVTGAKEGLQIAVKIVPYLVGFVVALGMFRAAGGFKIIADIFQPLLHKLGFPVQLLPLAIIRPFSGSASNSILADIAHHFGGQSMLAHMAATMMGSTETTFYVVMIYFGAVGITRTRYAVPAGLIADIVGVIAAVTITRLFY